MSLYRRNIMMMANPKPVFDCDTSSPIVIDSELQLFNGQNGLTEWLMFISIEGTKIHKVIGGYDCGFGMTIYRDKITITNGSFIDYNIKTNFDKPVFIKRENLRLYYNVGEGWNEIPVGDQLNYSDETFKVCSYGMTRVKCKIYNKSNIKI